MRRKTVVRNARWRLFGGAHGHPTSYVRRWSLANPTSHSNLIRSITNSGAACSSGCYTTGRNRLKAGNRYRAKRRVLMVNPLIRKLETFTKLSGDDKLSLQALTSDVRQVQARVAILEESATPTHAHLVVEGFACRCKILSGGERQITSFLIPGDLCDGHLLVLEAMDHTIETITQCRIAYIPHRTLHDLTELHPAITRALWWTSLVEE